MDTVRARLMEASRLGNLEGLEKWIDDYTSNRGNLKPILLEAVDYDQLNVLEYFKSHFFWIYILYLRDITMHAAKHGHLRILQHIGAVEKDDQENVVWVAAVAGHANIVSYLLNDLECEVSIDIIKNVVDEARNQNNKEIIDCVIKYMDKKIADLTHVNNTFKNP